MAVRGRHAGNPMDIFGLIGGLKKAECITSALDPRD
jgi:hypothetical protein